MIWEWWFALSGVFLLGLQTSISPCALTTNIAAISYLARKVSSAGEILFSGLLYTIGQTVVYVVLAILALSPLFLGGETLTRLLQSRIHGYLGPIFLVIGVMFLGLISFRFGSVSGEKAKRIADRLGIWGSLPLGALFALAFCPTSAATFLATIAIASRFQSPAVFAAGFGVGVAVPVFTFAAILAINATTLGKTFAVLGRIEWYLRIVAGLVFLTLGFWFSLRYVYFPLP